jgi:hypothetical protein
MKLLSKANIVWAAALAAALPLGVTNARAISAQTAPITDDSIVQPSQFQRVEWTEERRVQLRRAFWLLEHSDADYAGHRAKAMEHVKKAGEIISMDLHGKGYGGEDVKQSKSDDRMREARRIIQEVARESGPDEKERLHKAVAEIDRALAAR